MQDLKIIDLPPSRFFETEEYCKKRLDLLVKVCDFFNADGIVFIVKVINGRLKAIPVFGKYTLMVNSKSNYEYLMVNFSIPAEECPMFISKTCLVDSKEVGLLHLNKGIKMLFDVCDVIEDVLKKSASKSDWREFQAREMVSTESKDFRIWQEINSVEELMVKIDLESLRVEENIRS